MLDFVWVKQSVAADKIAVAAAEIVEIVVDLFVAVVVVAVLVVFVVAE